MEIIKKHDNLLVWLCITIFSIIIVFQVGISTGDELWNFQNIYKMVNGYPIYKEANVIITPIFFWMGEILFKIFGANYFIYRLFNVAIYSSMILIVYNILKQLKISKRKSLLYTLIVHYFIYTIITGGANYNTLALAFVLLGVYISLKYEGTNRFILRNGILLYLIAFTKQNIGVYYIVGTIVMQWIFRKGDKKVYIDIAKQIGIAMILSILTTSIFAINGNLEDFINYAFLGIGEFGSNNIAIEQMSIVYFLVAILTNICGIYIYKKIANQEQKRNIIIFTTIGISSMFIVYPIVNSFHNMLAILISAVFLMYLVDIVVQEFLSKKIVNYMILVMGIIFFLFGLKASIIIAMNNPFTGEYQNPYYGVCMPKELETKIHHINQYIKENDNKVIIFSKEAALYNIPEKRSNGAMDLPFLGNLGYGGEDEMLNNIISKIGYKILLTNENYWQESDKITNYIKEHYEKQGEIEEFAIYQIQ